METSASNLEAFRSGLRLMRKNGKRRRIYVRRRRKWDARRLMPPGIAAALRWMRTWCLACDASRRGRARRRVSNPRLDSGSPGRYASRPCSHRSLSIIEGKTEVIAAMKPFERLASLSEPIVIAGGFMSLDTCASHGMGLDRLPGSNDAGCAPRCQKPLEPIGRKCPFRSDLVFREPAQTFETNLA